jgi:hypothetical protein
MMQKLSGSSWQPPYYCLKRLSELVSLIPQTLNLESTRPETKS